jgi:hypothetical protein
MAGGGFKGGGIAASACLRSGSASTESALGACGMPPSGAADRRDPPRGSVFRTQNSHAMAHGNGAPGRAAFHYLDFRKQAHRLSMDGRASWTGAVRVEYASAKRERFAALDGWRGVCALLVALNHLNAYGHFYELPLVVNAWLLVDFFFVLSGFVISYAYMDRLDDGPSARIFVIRRFGRLWPLHAAVLAPLLALEIAKLVLAHSTGMALDHAAFSTENETVASVFTNLALVQSLGVHDVLTWNRPSWSISTEFYTYIVFALFLLFVRGRRARLLLPFVIIAMGSLVVALFSKAAMNTTWDYGIFRCLYGFFVGHLTYLLWRSGRTRAAFDRSGAWEPAAVSLAVIFVWLAGTTMWSLAAPLVFALVVLVFAHERGPVSRLMSARPVALLGAWSYSIYMVHWPLLNFLDRGLKFSERFTHIPTMIEKAFPWEDSPVELVYIGSRWDMDGLAVVYLLLVVGVAALTYAMIEQPGRRFFNRLAARPSETRPGFAAAVFVTPAPSDIAAPVSIGAARHHAAPAQHDHDAADDEQQDAAGHDEARTEPDQIDYAAHHQRQQRLDQPVERDPQAH